jgi:protein-S-isoprenylcysteine O-methyltransferase Ste14
MKISFGSGWFVSRGFELIQAAWIVTAAYFLISALMTNRIKRRERFEGRLVDTALLIGGYFFLFSQFPIFGARNVRFIAPQLALGIVGVAATYLGLGLTLWSRFRLGRYWSGVVALKQDHRLIQSGPYQVVRHPLYSGIILAAIGMGFYTTTWSSLLGIALLTACFERRAHKEDALLAAEFGAEFETYRQRTGRLIPRLG